MIVRAKKEKNRFRKVLDGIGEGGGGGVGGLVGVYPECVTSKLEKTLLAAQVCFAHLGYKFVLRSCLAASRLHLKMKNWLFKPVCGQVLKPEAQTFVLKVNQQSDNVELLIYLGWDYRLSPPHGFGLFGVF